MKAASSYFVNYRLEKVLYWQGYGALSVSKKGVGKVRDHVIKQKNYHRQKTTMELFETLYEVN